jgi:hypothetical protein
LILFSIKGSEKLEICPLASQIFGLSKIFESRPTLLISRLIKFFHQAALTLLIIAIPRGP